MMTSTVDMRYTLLAPMTQSYDSENESCSSEESLPQVELQSDPLLGNDLEFWSNELMRLGDELCKYGVTDIFMENKKSPDDIPTFPELFPYVEDNACTTTDLFRDIDMDSESDSNGRFDCCCSEQCRSYDSSSDWSYPSSPRSFGMPMATRKEDFLTLPSFNTLSNSLPSNLDPDRRKGIEEPYSFPHSFIRQQQNIFDMNIDNIQMVPQPSIKIENEPIRIKEEPCDSITPSPLPTEDEDSSDCSCNIMSHLNASSLDDSNFQEMTRKRRRLNSLSSDSDQSEEYVKESSSPRKRSGKLKSRTNGEIKHTGFKPKQLYQFLMDLLRDEDYCPQYIEWVSRDEKVFRLVDSAAVARMWGECKNRENMTYEKMSRALRYYYENGILERVPNCRLHYRFGKAAYEEYASRWQRNNIA
eukprot:Seg5087.1 transcript_id=Seg5087.1/GoldUCD/mRNA.D3Y31 product="ETS-related transcription factor Elf-2" protein_id=Seg5087.1/GoldUCD/D3Y31